MGYYRGRKMAQKKANKAMSRIVRNSINKTELPNNSSSPERPAELVYTRKILWNNYRNEQSYSNHRGDGDSFKQYVERMRAFRLTHAKTEPVEAKARGSLLSLLNLIPIYGIVVMPGNSQN